MQWAKKQGGGSKFNWGKPGDELHKKAPGMDSDEEEIEAAQDKFTQEISAKLLQDKLAQDELETGKTGTLDKQELLKAHILGPMSAAAAEAWQKGKEELLVRSREVIEIAYYSSTPSSHRLETSEKLFDFIEKLSPPAKTLVAKRMVQIALERDTADRELCGRFLKEAYIADLLCKEQIRRGLDLVYIDLDNIITDNPHAIEYIWHLLLYLIYNEGLFSPFLLTRLPGVVLGLQT